MFLGIIWFLRLAIQRLDASAEEHGESLKQLEHQRLELEHSVCLSVGLCVQLCTADMWAIYGRIFFWWEAAEQWLSLPVWEVELGEVGLVQCPLFWAVVLFAHGGCAKDVG